MDTQDSDEFTENSFEKDILVIGMNMINQISEQVGVPYSEFEIKQFKKSMVLSVRKYTTCSLLHCTNNESDVDTEIRYEDLSKTQKEDIMKLLLNSVVYNDNNKLDSKLFNQDKHMS